MSDPAAPSLPRTPTSWPDVPGLPVVPGQAIVIFDGTCDFCTRSVRFVRWLDRQRRLAFVPFQKPGVPEAHGLTVADCERAAWTVTPDGRRYPGAAAVNVALAVALGTRLPWVLYRLPGVRQVQELAYALIARNRARLPGDTPYCEQRPDECR
jgi:predicted DCC family thiol-disulfide oxidoreductase YuxK